MTKGQGNVLDIAVVAIAVIEFVKLLLLGVRGAK